MLDSIKKIFHRTTQNTRMAVAAIRREYTGEPLTEDEVSPDPFVQFENWFGEAVRLSTFDPSAMFLATAATADAGTETVGGGGTGSESVAATATGSESGSGTASGSGSETASGSDTAKESGAGSTGDEPVTSRREENSGRDQSQGSGADRQTSVSGRVVLLKGFDERGFVFYTHYKSRKGMQLAVNPRASLTFYWPEMVRQICIEGITEKVTAGESDAYFNSRPAGSRISAIASPQSRTVAGRADLEARTVSVREKGDLSRPEDWGGYRLRPDRIEFWQGRPNRLHDRILFTRDSEKSGWKMERLAP